MRTDKPKRKDETIDQPHDGTTRPPEAPLTKDLSDAYNDVQPARFKGGARSSIEAAMTDPDMDDTIGGE